MILADKIIELRKKNGMSQEELADKMGVSRQSVSKWESAQSVPDLNKILTLSKLFGVSTDVLLKDELALEESGDSRASEEPLRSVSMEEADEYMGAVKKNASLTAIGLIIIFAGISFFLMIGAISELYERYENVIGAASMAVMLAAIGAAVFLFIKADGLTKQFEYLKTQPIDTEYGVSGKVKELKKEHEKKLSSAKGIGVMFILLGVGAFFVIGTVGEKTSYGDVVGAAALGVMLMSIGFGVGTMSRASAVMESYDVLLEEENYRRELKK
ncbi:MAG: helix-turn-helix transcriptional regulator [Ruminococcus sp.]|nr:helix-turn-helix transcriptional regulator [Ruminococcus sp.]